MSRIICLLLCLAACSSEKERSTPGEAPTPPPPPAASAEPPDRVTVEHILIAFAGTIPGPTRSQEEAQSLAEEVFAKAKSGADFIALRNEYSDDREAGLTVARGPYKIANHPIAGRSQAQGFYPRSGMVGAFGDVSFSLAVGAVGMTTYAPGRENSPFGWHIIKRVE
ncbi:MAG: peptidylprolyl isomerase [Planctomycetaceae bacterium]